MKKYLLLIFILFSSCTVTPYNGLDREVYYVRSNGAELPVVISGKDTKEVILYVHGGPASSGLLYLYAPAWEEMREKYRMVFYDQRGSGGARGHITEESMTIDQHVKDLDAVINSVLTKYPNSSIYMIGHSYGGMISGAYASVNQNKLKGLIHLAPALNAVDMSTSVPEFILTKFIDPYLRGDFGSVSKADREYWEKAKAFYQNNSPLQLTSFIQHNKYVAKADPILGFDKFAKYYDEVLPKLMADPILEPLIWKTQMCVMLPVLDKNGESKRNLETDPKFNLGNITIPAILFLGDFDLQVPPESSRKAFNKIKGNKTIIDFKNASHNPFLEYPEKLQNDITTFIQNNP